MEFKIDLSKQDLDPPELAFEWLDKSDKVRVEFKNAKVVWRNGVSVIEAVKANDENVICTIEMSQDQYFEHNGNLSER